MSTKDRAGKTNEIKPSVGTLLNALLGQNFEKARLENHPSVSIKVMIVDQMNMVNLSTKKVIIYSFISTDFLHLGNNPSA
jgi:hypothetical protein